LDLSALAIFSPVPAYSVRKVEEFFDCSCHGSKDSDCGARKRQKFEKPLDASSLIFAVPWYKTVSNLHLWDVSFIDVVLVSSAMGMLGLPFLTRSNGFSAKVSDLFSSFFPLFFWGGTWAALFKDLFLSFLKTCFNFLHMASDESDLRN